MEWNEHMERMTLDRIVRVARNKSIAGTKKQSMLPIIKL